jgi:lysylphosphatidylglycerol synthetase-like protein (DUF2156 family)
MKRILALSARSSNLQFDIFQKVIGLQIKVFCHFGKTAAATIFLLPCAYPPVALLPVLWPFHLTLVAQAPITSALAAALALISIRGAKNVFSQITKKPLCTDAVEKDIPRP